MSLFDINIPFLCVIFDASYSRFAFCFAVIVTLFSCIAIPDICSTQVATSALDDNRHIGSPICHPFDDTAKRSIAVDGFHIFPT